MTALNDAVRYREQGWSLIPMKMSTKTPAVRWKRYQKAMADEVRLRKWFDSDRGYGLAVIYGEISGGLASRDFDNLGSYERWATEHPDLAEKLPTVETRRGRHVYCRFATDDVSDFRRQIGKPDGWGAIGCEGGELRAGVGCYSVIPNSKHPSGFVYRWTKSPFDVPIPTLTVAESGFFVPRATEITEETEDIEEIEAIG